jgi:hypothetical protein
MDLNMMKKGTLSGGLFQKGSSLSYTLRGLKRRHFLDRERTLTLGRASTCDICVLHPDVAPLQCRFERTSEGDLLLFSENEKRPVHVNGYPVQFKSLSPGDEIRFGSLKLHVSNKVTLQPGAGPPASSIRYQGDFSELLIRAIRRGHWLVASILFHLALVLVLYNMEKEQPMIGDSVGFYQDTFADSMPPDLDDWPSPEDADDPLEELKPPEPVASEFDNPLDDPTRNQSDVANLLNKAEFFLGSEGASGPGGNPGSRILRRKSAGLGGEAGGEGEWKQHVGRLRSTGMDIAILFDSTGSMEGFIREVKVTIEGMVHVLRSIVPDLRLSLVTYKGDPRSSTYVVASTPIVNDAYELLNFMRTIDASGGSAEMQSAILTAMQTACGGAGEEQLAWRRDTEKAIVIIGDAPPFTQEAKGCLLLSRRFSARGKVATIYKASGGETRQLEDETIEIFKAMAAAGGGPFLMHDEEGDVVYRIVTAVLGTRWKKNIHAAFDKRDSGRWLKIVEHKQDEGDFSWFLTRFKRQYVRPELVDAMIEMGGERVAREMWRCLLAHEDKPWLLQRTLYVLQNITDLNVGYVHVGQDRLSNKQMFYIAEALKYQFGPELLGGK